MKEPQTFYMWMPDYPLHCTSSRSPKAGGESSALCAGPIVGKMVESGGGMLSDGVGQPYPAVHCKEPSAHTHTRAMQSAIPTGHHYHAALH